MTLKILIADDHQLFRKGLISLINQNSDYEVISEASNGRIAVRLAKKLSPDIVIMDVNMPELNGIDATRLIRSDSAEIKIIALSMYSDKRFIKEMLKSGSNGYVVKDCAFDELLIAIKTVMAGNIYLSPDVTASIVDDITNSATASISQAYPLSTREREVLQLIAEGNSTKEIASSMCLSPKTIESHRKNIMDKLEIHSVAELTKFAIREGLTSLDFE